MTAGATNFQIDEPLLCRYPEDFEIVVRTCGKIFDAAGSDAMTAISTYFGGLGEVAGRLGELPGTHIGMDVVSDAGNLDLLGQLPEGRGVVLGVFDARTTMQEDAVEVAESDDGV